MTTLLDTDDPCILGQLRKVLVEQECWTFEIALPKTRMVAGTSRKRANRP